MNNIIITTQNVDESNWLKSFKNKIDTSESNLTLMQVACEVTGCLEDSDEYFEMLHNLYNTKSLNVRLFSEGLIKTMDPEKFKSIQKILSYAANDKSLSANRLIALLNAEELVPNNLSLFSRDHFIKSLKALFEHFKRNNEKGFLSTNFGRILTDVIKWQENYIVKWFSECNEIPKVIWYKKMSISEQYFVYYLILLGCDIVIFSPDGNKKLTLFSDVIQTIALKNKSDEQDFPVKPRERAGTIAFKASKQIDELLHYDTSMLYKAWQFREYTPTCITLKTTYDEIFILAKEHSMLRPNFRVESPQIYIPSIFGKIAGMSSNSSEYWRKLHSLIGDETILIKEFPFTAEYKGNPKYHFEHCLDENGMLSVEKIRKSVFWKFNKLPEGLQNAIANVIIRRVNNPKIINNECDLYKQQLYIFGQSFEISDLFLNMMQKFDYPKSVPKVLIYNNGNSGSLSKSDVNSLLMVHEIGFDVIIYNPTAQNDIELYLENKYFDTHSLEEVKFHEDFKEQSILKKMFLNLSSRKKNK